MKICSKCGLPKDVSEYTWSIRNIKKHSACNSCRAVDRMGYYEKNKEKELAYKWDRQLRKREDARQFVDAYKRIHPGVDCGNSDIESLTFDHVRGAKKMTIANMVNLGHSIEALQAGLINAQLGVGLAT